MRVKRWWSGQFALMFSLGLLSLLTSPLHAASDEPLAGSTEKFNHIVDNAHMFDPLLVSVMNADLETQSKLAKLPVLIETVESLDGKTIDEAVARKELPPQEDGVYILLAKREKKIEVRVAKRFESVVGETERKGIRDAFIEGLRKGKPEEAVTLGVRALNRALRKVRNTELAPPEPSDASPKSHPNKPGSSLVVRNQVKLALSGARRILEGAEAKASELGLKVNIAVVDDGGHLLAFARMDGARPASGYTAITKATTAATFRQETGPSPRGTTTPDPLLNISLQNAAAASGGKLTTLFGGVPVLVDGQVIGGVGVGGGTGEQDAIVAKAGIEALLTELKESQSPPTSEPKPTLP
ncbi:glc operon protein GlcG [Singulisphaera sp. GP187]|uniref:heme-binding protein n=1 Tax=Singulisphaera sp. GP187 TaxID=1882752 RepID=UPI0009276CF4|nr:heme-binding protein [Singulisphaera sp. GP187]SIN90185.1 glc operon protein GlcG [Singulisphaera sp. GP187]